MPNKTLHYYVGFMSAAALAALALVDWPALRALPTEHLIGLCILILLGVLSDATAFSSRVSQGGGSSLIFLPLVAAQFLYGQAAAVLFVVLTASISEFVFHRKTWLRGLFNVSQLIVATTIASIVFSLLGGYTLVLAPPEQGFNPQVLPVLGWGMALLGTNVSSVAVVVALSNRRNIWHTIRMAYTREGGTIFNDFLVLPIAILVAFLYYELHTLGLLVAMLPLLFVRYAYLSKYRLEEANRDLLTVLVKAIETRDPYTSGHSMRVKELSREIGNRLDLGDRQQRELETAALLHDIGKIEVVYEEILRKPDSLSLEERRIIESHVTRGVEILTSLSSFSSRIIDAVKYHHELYDGSGYPEGLAKEDIPLYARIIKLSDAIDAMLSARPYREALTVQEVEDQVRKFSGTQFDPTIAGVVLGSGVIRQHVERMRSDMEGTELRREGVLQG